MTKIQFQNNSSPYINDTNLNQLQTNIETAIAQAILDAHPVGSYYWSSASTSPATLFGGTWERVKDKFIYALGDSGSAGDTGGNSSHNLDVSGIYAQVNPTGGGMNYNNSGKAFSTNYAVTGAGGTKAQASNSNTNAGINIAGTLSSGDNLPPYVKAYCWKRTA